MAKMANWWPSREYFSGPPGGMGQGKSKENKAFLLSLEFTPSPNFIAIYTSKEEALKEKKGK
jgi:hypothetical protein